MSAALLAYHGIEPGVVVGILASWGGLWFLNACRIVYVLDEISPVHRVGFAWHPARACGRGEERFSIEWHSDDTVRYDLLAFTTGPLADLAGVSLYPAAAAPLCAGLAGRHGACRRRAVGLPVRRQRNRPAP